MAPSPRSRCLQGSPSDEELLEKAKDANGELHDAVAARVVGQERVVDLMLVALLARGHALLVGVPGLAKTLLVASLAEALDLELRPRAVHARSPARRHHRHRRPPGGRGRPGRRAPARALPAGPDLPQPDPRRRDQPHAAEDAGRAAPGDAGAPRHGRHRRRTRCPIRSRSSRRATRSSRRARIRSPRRSSIASSSRSTSTTRPRTRSARSRAGPRAPTSATRPARPLDGRRARAPGARPAHPRHRRGGGARRRARSRDTPGHDKGTSSASDAA